MTELTPQLVEGLMNNVPPQQDFRQAVTIVSSDPGSVVYRIDVPQDQCNYHGTIFGGFINCMLEAAAGMATYAYGMNNVAMSRGSPSKLPVTKNQPPPTQREGEPKGPPSLAMLPCCQGVC